MLASYFSNQWLSMEVIPSQIKDLGVVRRALFASVYLPKACPNYWSVITQFATMSYYTVCHNEQPVRQGSWSHDRENYDRESPTPQHHRLCNWQTVDGWDPHSSLFSQWASGDSFGVPKRKVFTMLWKAAYSQWQTKPSNSVHWIIWHSSRHPIPQVLPQS